MAFKLLPMLRKLFFLMAVFACLGDAAQPKKAQQTLTLSLPTIQCDMCKNRIETYLKRYDGIMDVKIYPKRKEGVIKYLTDRITDEDIKAAIATAGYDANEVTAEPDAYKRLPACCKKPEDGGGKKN